MDALLDAVGRYGMLAWKRRWWAATAAWVICVFGWFGVAMLPDIYQSSAKVYIDADSVLTPLLRGLTVEGSLSDELELLQQMLLARPNVERIIEKTDLQLDATTPLQTERLVSALSQQIKVVAQDRSVFTITYRNPNRQLAADVVQAVLASFIENKTGDRREDMARATTFLDSQIASYETQLRDAEQRRAAFRKKYIDLLPGDGGGHHPGHGIGRRRRTGRRTRRRPARGRGQAAQPATSLYRRISGSGDAEASGRFHAKRRHRRRRHRLGRPFRAQSGL
jgi:polysaccharide chain length determinant protein (PEP-CTERM system associated)